MSALRHALRGALERIAGALSANKLASPAPGLRPRSFGAKLAEARPAAVEDSDGDALDRERQLRVLMAHWM